jgi:hypothetical protein
VQQPGRWDLVMYRGDSYSWRVRLWEDEPGGTPVDITGATVAAEIREKLWGVTVVELGAVLTPPNIIELTMAPEMWADCPIVGVWDLQVSMPPAEVRTVLAGDFISEGDVVDSVVPSTVGRVI